MRARACIVLLCAALAAPAAAQDAGVISRQAPRDAPEVDAERIAAEAAARAEMERRAQAHRQEEEAQRSAAARAAAEQAELDRGLPVCPGDPRCKKKDPDG